MTRVLITGGGGFIGAHLAHALAGGDHEIDLIDDLSRGQADDDLRALTERPNVRLLERDLLAPDGIEGLPADYGLIFHLAAIVGVANVLEAPYKVLRKNVELLDSVLDLAAAQSALERFVFASTSEIYAGALEVSELPIPTPEDVPLTVPNPQRPRASYMLSKLYGEALVHQSGLPATVVRPHNVYGPRMGMAHVIPELLQRAHEAPDGGTLEVYSVDHRRTFCFVADAVELISRAAESGKAEGETLNVGAQGPEVTIGDLAEMVLATVGRRLEIKPLPAHPGSPERRCPDMSKAESLTRYSAQVPLEEGLRRTYDWYRQAVFTTDSGAG